VSPRGPHNTRMDLSGGRKISRQLNGDTLAAMSAGGVVEVLQQVVGS
jgi:hypothetical protein